MSNTKNIEVDYDKIFKVILSCENREHCLNAFVMINDLFFNKWMDTTTYSWWVITEHSKYYFKLIGAMEMQVEHIRIKQNKNKNDETNEGELRDS